jgi:hypothetical protein
MRTGRIGSRRILGALLAAVLVALLLGTTGCGLAVQQSTDEGVSVFPVPAMPEESRDSAGAPSSSDGGGVKGEAYSPSGDVAQNVADADRLVIRAKTLRIDVKDVTASVDSIRLAAKEFGGVITALQIASDVDGPIYRYDEAVGTQSAALSGYVTVRVPVKDFEAFVTDISKLGTVRSQSESSDDVTQQHVDLAARLKNLQAEEVRLRDFFDAAKDVKDMLAIEQELARVRGEIESLDAQVKYLERQAAMATVTVELTEPTSIVSPGGDDWGFRDAVTAGIRGAAQVLKVLIVVLITVAPYALVGLLAFFGIRALVRARRRRTHDTRPAPSADTTPPEA